MTGVASMVKDMSGYNVRLGYARHLFSASGCNGVYGTGATGAIGMILAAKNDDLQDCVEPLAVKSVPVTEEQPEEPVQTNGSLFGEGEIETVEPEKPKKPAEPKKPRLIWKKVADTIGNIYDFISKEDNQ